MKKLAFTLLFLSSSISVFAQTNLDSLLQIWEDTTQRDTIRVRAYTDYIQYGELYVNPEEAFILSDNLIKYANKHDYQIAKSIGLQMKAISLSVRSDHDNAILYYKESLRVSDSLNYLRGIAAATVNLAGAYSEKSNYIQSIRYFMKGIEAYKKTNNTGGIGMTLGNIGSVYEQLGDKAKGKEYFLKGLKVLNENNIENKYTSHILTSIGVNFLFDNEPDKAFPYLEKALKISTKINDQHAIANILDCLGGVYRQKGETEKAVDYINRSLKIFRKIGDPSGIATCLTSLGEIKGEKKQFNESIKYCKQGYENAIEAQHIKYQQAACKCLYQAYKGLGNGNQAIVYGEILNGLNDSINVNEITKKLQQMEFQKQVLADSLANAEEARLIEEAHKEEVRKNNQTRNALLGGGFIVLLLAGGLYSRLRYVRKSKALIEKEKDRSENLLLNILPAEIAEELKQNGEAAARDFDDVSILFTDFKGFTEASEKLTASALVKEINTCFKAFDDIVGKYQVEKIKTIGDAYMAAGGLPVPTKDSIKNTVLAALEMQEFISSRKAEMDTKGLPSFEMRVGIHTGPIVAGIVGVKKFQYDIWGDTVNTASRMESAGEVGKVNVSKATYDLLKNDPEFTFESRGKIEAKGKGEIEMFFVTV